MITVVELPEEEELLFYVGGMVSSFVASVVSASVSIAVSTSVAAVGYSSKITSAGSKATAAEASVLPGRLTFRAVTKSEICFWRMRYLNRFSQGFPSIRVPSSINRLWYSTFEVSQSRMPATVSSFLQSEKTPSI